MVAYLLILVAIASRVFAFSHPVLLNFTAVGAALLYFGARRSFHQAIVPVALLAAADYCMTVFAYGYAFHWESYVVTWLWYGGVIWLGAKILGRTPGMGRVAGGAFASATSFFLLSNFVVWAGTAMYPPTAGGLGASYLAGLPFYRNDLASTLLISVALFGVPALLHRIQRARSISTTAAA